MRNTFFSLVTGALLLAASGGVMADAVHEGSITAGHPVTGFVGGVTEIATPCDPASDLNGVDGVWFDVGSEAGGSFELTVSAGLDADIYFYSAGCSYLGGVYAGGLGATESGSIPGAATYAIVDGFAGSGTFVLTVTG